ncbi:hypothetical protein DM02DRAFT_611603 [Periconia macrospinosa]|uniref:Uncharacterized protein n=1 Tax=Periconia macrospinosa TaxID=97972 RepID=A0A2V1E275_9PLEO|nr:hypothetical protein DM02DRAFT_611603 [Periconia macrospinosa]
MRFTSTVFALSSLFAASFAAPAPQSGLTSLIGTDELIPELGLPLPLSRRTDDHPVIYQLNTCMEGVKGHTATINKTVAGGFDFGAKGQMMGTVKGEFGLIIKLVTSIIGEVTGILSGGGEISGDIKGEVVKLVFGLLLEIMFTLKGVLGVFKISVFELLGSSVFLLLSVCLHLITVLDAKIEGVLSLVFGLLGGFSGVLHIVLGGLFGKLQGILGGGAFGLVGGLLSCLSI